LTVWTGISSTSAISWYEKDMKCLSTTTARSSGFSIISAFPTRSSASAVRSDGAPGARSSNPSSSVTVRFRRLRAFNDSFTVIR